MDTSKAARKRTETKKKPAVFFSTGLFVFKQEAARVKGQREGSCETLSLGEESAIFLCMRAYVRACVCV